MEAPFTPPAPRSVPSWSDWSSARRSGRTPDQRSQEPCGTIHGWLDLGQSTSKHFHRQIVTQGKHGVWGPCPGSGLPGNRAGEHGDGSDMSAPVFPRISLVAKARPVQILLGIVQREFVPRPVSTGASARRPPPSLSPKLGSDSKPMHSNAHGYNRCGGGRVPLNPCAGASGVGDPKAKLRRELPHGLERGSLVSFGKMDFRERARQDTGRILTRSGCVTNKPVR